MGFNWVRGRSGSEDVREFEEVGVGSRVEKVKGRLGCEWFKWLGDEVIVFEFKKWLG